MSYYGDAAEMYLEQIIKARKPHKCYECNEIIAVGEHYEYISGRWEDDWRCYRFCLTCSEIGKALTCDGGREFGTLWENLREYVFPDMTQACIAKCSTTAAKRRLTGAWLIWKGL